MARSAIAPGSIEEQGPARDVFTLTPHDVNAMATNRGFMVNVAGNVTVRAVQSSADVVLTVLAGVLYPISIKFLRSTGTTATGIVGVN